MALENEKSIELFGKPTADLKVAILHYWLVSWRGGEKVVESIIDLFPNADVYTLFADKEITDKHLPGTKIISSCLNTNILRPKYQKIFPLYPLGVKSINLEENYDLIISSESGPIKGIKNPSKIPHVCYIHTPMRYCHGYMNEYLDTMSGVIKPFAKLGFEYLRKWDLTTANSVDHYIANSDNVKQRVQKYYGRDADVVFPPIAEKIFEAELHKGDFNNKKQFLSFGAITPYKKIDLLVNVFNKNPQWELVVIGEGGERVKLTERAGPNVKFTGPLPWGEIENHILNSKCLIFPGEEDFGMIPLEVMAKGLPVIAYGKGGALETVKEGLSGLFFEEQTEKSLLRTLFQFEKESPKFKPVEIRKHAETFKETYFQEAFLKSVSKFLKEYQLKKL